MYAQFNRFEIKMTKSQATSASHQGRCDDDVTALLELPAIKRQFKKIDPALIAAELREYGAWDEAELSDIAANQERIVWLATGDIVENRP